MAEIYDTDTEEIKELVKRQGAQINEMQDTIRKMHNAQRRHLMYKIVWWLLVTGVAAYAYYTYAWPMIQQIMDMYGTAAGWEDKIAEFFSNFRSGTSTPE